MIAAGTAARALLGGRAGFAAPPPPRRRSRSGWLWWLAGIPAGLLVALVLLLALLAGALKQQCPTTATRDEASGGPGSLGGVAGTGLSRAQLDAVRHSPYASARRTTGTFVSTSYGPPWGGIQGTGQSTSGG